MIQQIVATYLKRFAVAPRYLTAPPKSDTTLIIAIPAFKEPNILATLRSLGTCHRPSGIVEVIITINAPEDSSEEILEINSNCINQIEDWIKNEQPDFITTHIIREESIPKKDAGAGYARKIGMDEAVQRWAQLKSDGPIICLDADCTVSENYLIEAEEAFRNKKIKVGHFHFEHDYEKESDAVLRYGIIQYELHLRCYIEGLRQAGYPNAIHTVGSCMAVRASSYAKAGGMNKRKAGEDFYFLHKLVPHGGWKNISNATVYPSCRVSDRVPFGTGRAQLEWVNGSGELLTYNSEIFQKLKPFLIATTDFYIKDPVLIFFDESLRDFLLGIDFINQLNKMRKQSKSEEAFLKRYWQWMDGFMVLKLTHYLRDKGFENQTLISVSKTLIKNDESTHLGNERMLLFFREKQKVCIQNSN